MTRRTIMVCDGCGKEGDWKFGIAMYRESMSCALSMDVCSVACAQKCAERLYCQLSEAAIAGQS